MKGNKIIDDPTGDEATKVTIILCDTKEKHLQITFKVRAATAEEARNLQQKEEEGK